MKKILLFEDDPNIWKRVLDVFRSAGWQVEVVDELPNLNSPEFQTLLSRAHEFGAIVWDGYMNAIETAITTNGYIEAFAKVFQGPMVAWSRSDDCKKVQIQQGCKIKMKDKNPNSLLAELRFQLEVR